MIAVGGGAGRAVDLLNRRGFRAVSFLACDTDGCALQQLSLPCYRLGEGIMKGHVAGGWPKIGYDAAEASAGDIERLLSDGTQLAIVVACLGGGAGTGAAPVIAKIAKKMGLAVVGLLSYPFESETHIARYNAVNGYCEMCDQADSTSMLSNEELLLQEPDLSIREALQKADDVLARAIENLAGISGKDGQPICAEDVKAFYKAGFYIRNFIGQ